MKCTDRALTHLRRLSGSLLSTIPDSIYVLSHSESVPKGIDPTTCISICENLPSKEIVKLAKGTGINHFVQISQEYFEQELNVAAIMILNPDQFIAESADLIFSNGKKENEVKWQFRSLNEREEIKNEIEWYFNSVSAIKRVKDAALGIVDEMFTNALNHGGQGAKVSKYEDNLFGEIFISYFEERVLVGCIDPVGSLTRENYIKYLWASYLGEKLRGSGIGCRMILNHSLGFYAAVKPGVKTVVCATLPLNRGSTFDLDRAKNLHLNLN